MRNSTKFSNISEELVTYILSRLSIKTICQCKSVCKSWNLLISEGYFAQIHLSKSPNHILFLSSKKNCLYDINAAQIQYLKHDSLLLTYNWVTLVGACNGFLCLLKELNDSREFCFILNPVRGDYIVLPGLKQYRLLGFGFSSVSNEYKVIRVATVCDGVYECQIYTLGCKNWRKVEGSIKTLRRCVSYGVAVNGVLHWFIANRDEICCFDIEKEQFNLIPYPLKFEGFLELACLRNSLCISHNSKRNFFVAHSYDIWVMMEYGVKESWSKNYVIQVSYSKPLSPIRIEEDGKFLMLDEYNAKMVLYDPSTRELDEVNDKRTESWYKAIPFVASFLSFEDIFQGKHPIVFKL